MNQKTAKLLGKWATASGHTKKSAKNAWRHLNAKERTLRRQQLKADLG